MITNQIYYLLLTGSATSLLNDMVRTVVALSGPPDVLSPGWHGLEKWEDLPPWGTPAVSDPVANEAQ